MSHPLRGFTAGPSGVAGTFERLALPENVHVWVLGFAIPTTSVALIFGYKQHMARSPLIVGCFGLLLLSVGVFALLGSPLETPVTVIGSLGLVSAHLQNWRLRHHPHRHE